MSLTSRITLTSSRPDDPEDLLSSSLGVIFPDDVNVQHGDADHGLVYTSPHLPKPLNISLFDPEGEGDRRLFSHYLWNSSLLLAELIEAGTLGLKSESGNGTSAVGDGQSVPASAFSVTSLTTLELGAGTALPSLVSALLGASEVVITDYPSPAVLDNLSANVVRNVRSEHSPLGTIPTRGAVVAGHEWGDVTEPNQSSAIGRGAFDRVLAADCLWMPWQHDALRRSISWFLREDDGGRARAWVVAGFHTGREKMRGFFEAEALAGVGLEVERMWERDCDGHEREWAWDRGAEDVTERKRWLVVAILRRVRGGGCGSENQAGIEKAK